MEKYAFENINDPEEVELSKVMQEIIERNREIVQLVYDNLDFKDLEEGFPVVLFSNLKLKIVEALARDMGVSEPRSRKAWDKVIEKYPLDKLEKIFSQVARAELKTWTYRNNEAHY